MTAGPAAYEALYVYTMGRPGFLLQHVVDAHGAQTADARVTSIGIVFALVGLYLRVERRFDGRQVQRIHARLAGRGRDWPAVHLPSDRGAMSAADVMNVPAGFERDRAIDDWCRVVWAAYADSRAVVVALLQEHAIDQRPDHR